MLLLPYWGEGGGNRFCCDVALVGIAKRERPACTDKGVAAPSFSITVPDSLPLLFTISHIFTIEGIGVAGGEECAVRIPCRLPHPVHYGAGYVTTSIS